MCRASLVWLDSLWTESEEIDRKCRHRAPRRGGCDHQLRHSRTLRPACRPERLGGAQCGHEIAAGAVAYLVDPHEAGQLGQMGAEALG